MRPTSANLRERELAQTRGKFDVTIAYDNAGRRTALTLPNGVVTEYGYDIGSRLTRLTYSKGAATLGNLAYDYDAAGKVTKLGGSFVRTGLPQPISNDKLQRSESADRIWYADSDLRQQTMAISRATE